MLAPFASVSDYETIIGPSTARTESDLNAMSARIRGYCHWMIWPQAEETITLDGTGTHVLTLPTRYLVEIAELTETQRGTGQTAVTIDPADLEWSETGLVWKSDHSKWTRRARGVTAKITHGYAEVPADIQKLTLDLAVRASTNPMSLRRNQIGMVAQDYATGLYEDELAFLDSTYRRRA